MESIYTNLENGEESDFRFPGRLRAKPRDDDFETCLVCGGVSSYRRSLTDEEAGVDNGIAYIGTTSCFEWECGHCRAHHVVATAPILAECYTHINPEEMNGHDQF